MAGMRVASCDITDLLMQQGADFELSVVVGQSSSSGCIRAPVQVRQLKLQKQVEGIQTMLGLILVAHCRSDLQFVELSQSKGVGVPNRSVSIVGVRSPPLPGSGFGCGFGSFVDLFAAIFSGA